MELLTPESPAATAQVASGFGRAHAKAILLGEHAVLYGSPALAIPVPLLTVTARAARYAEAGPPSFLVRSSAGIVPHHSPGLLRIAGILADDSRGRVEVLLQSEIPAGRGLGSSAACARAVVLALADLAGREFGQSEVYELVQVAENIAHGRASGVDAITTGASGPLLFQNGAARAVRLGFDGYFVIADSGVPGHTEEAVRLVAKTFAERPGRRERFVNTVTGLIRSSTADVTDVGRFGESMIECHKALRELELSTPVLDSMADAAMSAGAAGAKLSGSGLGGCLIALAGTAEIALAVSRSLCDAGALRTWTVPVGRFSSRER
ncbi:mevalonate kinase [Lentzea jiangxiensis]|uniref:mevalonate kinase n=1 Tax=Lentzea jiangxiensis TaxID=641025 RepID=A0A1H0WD39_9PSEU|nr:mevalonate kinase [Lentzea jiangxiensis]SDP88670.1 mevalonate kinase [Lentzea jiangxiensis]